MGTKNHLKVAVNWVKSEEMLADGLSRWSLDRDGCTLDTKIFAKVQQIFTSHGCHMEVDMFASPGNTQLKKFVSRWPHYQAIGCNALEVDLQDPKFAVPLWANPPWTIILAWLERLRRHPHLVCGMAVPKWVGTVWWPLLARLHMKGTPIIEICPREGLFLNCQGDPLPSTKWPLLCLILSGQCYKENKFLMKTSIFI